MRAKPKVTSWTETNSIPFEEVIKQCMDAMTNAWASMYPAAELLPLPSHAYCYHVHHTGVTVSNTTSPQDDSLTTRPD